jgi:hypothetical protein
MGKMWTQVPVFVDVTGGENPRISLQPRFHELSEPSVLIKGIVSPDWKGLQMVSLDRFEV